MNRNMKAITWAVEQKQLDPGPFRMLIMLASRVGKKNYEVWPSYQTMADDSKIGRSTARRYVEELCALKLLEKVGSRWRENGGRSVNVYRLNIGNILISHDEEDEEDQYNQTVDPMLKSSTGHAHSYGQGAVPNGEHSNELLKEGTSDNIYIPPSRAVKAPHATEDLFQLQEIAEVEPSLHEAVIARWNALADRFPGVCRERGLDDPTKAKITARGRDAVKQGAVDAKAGWNEIFDAVEISTFLQGAAPPSPGQQFPFNLTLDFVLRPSKFRRILAGGYNDRHDARTSNPITGQHYGPNEQAGRAVLSGILSGLDERRANQSRN